MKVVLLAAGRSERLKPLKDKSFIEFLGKPLIQHQIEALGEVGIKDLIVVGGKHNLDKLEKLFKKLPCKTQLVEQKNLDDGMAGALMSSEKFINTDPLLIISANDVVESTAFEQIMAAHRVAEHGLLLAKEVDSYFPGGYLSIDSDYFCRDIVEKPGEGNEPSSLVNIVVHYFGESKKLFDTLRQVKSDKDDRYEVALAEMMKSGSRIRAIPYEGFWQPIKYPWDILSLMDFFLGSLSKYEIKDLENQNIEIADTATVKGGVYLEDGVRILDNAVVVGPAYIGENTVIASNTLVRDAHIGSDCVIGFSTEVARSYLGNNVWTHSNYIGDSIIGNNCSFGAGTVTGNLRLDEGDISVNIKGKKTSSKRNKFGILMGDNVRCGINTSFMPGVKIGNNAMIGAGIVVNEDIEDNKFAYGKTGLIIKDNRSVIDTSNREKMQANLLNP